MFEQLKRELLEKAENLRKAYRIRLCSYGFDETDVNAIMDCFDEVNAEYFK